MQALKHDRVPIREQLQHAIVGDLVGRPEAQVPPDRVKRLGSTTVPLFAILMNGVRRPRSESSSSTAASENRSSNPAR